MMDSVVAAWWSWMVPMLWQVSLLVAILAVIDRLIRNWAWPQVRYALWLLVLVKLVIPPWWTLPGGVLPLSISHMTVAIEARQNSGEVSATPLGRVDDGGSGARSGDSEAAGGVRPEFAAAAGGAGIFWPTVAFFLWLGGMIVIGSVVLLRTSRLARGHREQKVRPTIPGWFHELLIATSDRLELERVPAVVFSDQAVTPAVYGLLRPVLLLPAHYTDTLSRREAEHVLLHEMAHLKRGDLVVHAVFLVLRVLYWFNPFVAYAHRQLKHVREICCDLTVAGILREKTAGYRQTLVETARFLLTESLEPGMGLLGVFEEPYKVLARIRWLERPTWRHGRRVSLVAGLVMVLAAPVLLPMAAGGTASAAMVPMSQPSGGGDLPIRDARAIGSLEDESIHVYIRSVFKAEETVLGFVIRSQLKAVSEIWVGPDIIEVTERDRTVIFDRSRQLLLLIDHQSETWVETPLPLEIAAVLGEELQRSRRDIKTTGEVHKTGDTRRILGRRCQEFRVSSWNSRGSSRSNPQTISVWTSTDVPFDLDLLDEVLFNLRLLFNRDASFRSELEKMPGLQMRLEMQRGSAFLAKRFVDEVVEITHLAPPEGTYRPPRGYRLLDHFEHMDL